MSYIVIIVLQISAHRRSVAEVYFKNEKYQFAGYLIRFIVDKNKALPEYIFYLTKSNQYWKWIELQSKTGTLTNKNAKQYSSFTFPLPPLKVQKEIVAEIDGYQKIIDGARQVLDNYKPIINISADWNMIELNEIASIKGGYAFKSSEFVDDGIQILKMGNVKMGNLDLGKSPAFMPHERLEEFREYVIKKGDILITMTGTQNKRDFGEVCLLEDDKMFLLNQRVGKIELKSDKVIPYYLSLMMSHDIYQNEIFKKATGVRQANISSKALENIPIPLPSIQTQEKIVEQIESEQEIVNANKKLISIYEQKIKNKIAEVWGE